MGITIDKENTLPPQPKMWLINGNCFTEAFCKDEETAIQYAQTLVNCVDCVDCKECQNCKRCMSCENCVECYDCKNCSYATLLNDKENIAFAPTPLHEKNHSLKNSLNSNLDEFKPLALF